MRRGIPWISGGIVLFLLFASVFAPLIVGDRPNPDHWLPLINIDPHRVDFLTADLLAAPSGDHWFGTDNVGRDVFARLLYAIRNSLFFALAVTGLCFFVGIAMGGLMGFLGGKWDLVLSRFIEVVGNFPVFLLMLTLVALVGQSYTVLVIAMLIGGWIPFCRLTRGEALKLRKLEFMSAAQVLGASHARIFFRHLLPNAITPVLILIPFHLTGVIGGLGALSYLGFGEPLHVPSIGELLRQGKNHFREAWWLVVFPGGLLFIMTLSLTLLGGALRDLFDPRSGSTN